MNNLKKKLNKKGSLPDVFYIAVIGLAVAFILIIGLFLLGKFNTSITPALNNVVSGSGDPITQTNNFAEGSFNSIYLIIVVGLIIAVIITAFLTQIHPIFFPLFVVLSIGAVIFSATISNVYESLSTTTAFASPVAKIPAMDYIMLKLPYFIAIIIMIVLVVLFGKRQQQFSSGGGFSGVE